MAHWLLRERMAEHTEDGREQQERIRKEQRRPERNKGDGAARGLGAPKTDFGTRHDEPRGHESSGK